MGAGEKSKDLREDDGVLRQPRRDARDGGLHLQRVLQIILPESRGGGEANRFRGDVSDGGLHHKRVLQIVLPEGAGAWGGELARYVGDANRLAPEIVRNANRLGLPS